MIVLLSQYAHESPKTSFLIHLFLFGFSDCLLVVFNCGEHFMFLFVVCRHATEALVRNLAEHIDLNRSFNQHIVLLDTPFGFLNIWLQIMNIMAFYHGRI